MGKLEKEEEDEWKCPGRVLFFHQVGNSLAVVLTGMRRRRTIIRATGCLGLSRRPEKTVRARDYSKSQK